MKDTYDKLITRLREVHTLGSVRALLGWDQETYMPQRAQARRAEQLALMSEISHRRFIDDAVGELLEALPQDAVSSGLGPEAAANVRETKRGYDRARKLPPEFVAELARACSHAHEAWIDARKQSDFGHFAPHLETIVGLKQKEAELVGYEDEIYDALLDEYEPGATAAEVGTMLVGLREALVPLVKRVGETTQPADPAADARWPAEAQKQLCRRVAAAMGFDFEAGRLDVSTHPFCSGVDVGDVRLTTRYHENDLGDALFGVMHEVGHGLYEQGLEAEHFGTPMGEACSTGMHESQSRLWENQVGRSRPFWEHFFPILREHFPEAAGGLDVEAWYRRINRVEPSLIRVEADEATYNLHILLRFEIERELLSGELSVSGLPAVWNRRMEEYLGLTPPDDSQGVLQDIHWSFGGFGYFPTYTLGNLYSAQLYDALRRDLGDVDDLLRHGRLLEIRDWLRDKVHRKGMLLRAPELIREICGAEPSAEPFQRYIEAKVGELYGV